MNDRIIIEGIFQAVTQKAVLLASTDSDDERWFPLRYVRVISGDVGRGAYAEISIPCWLYEKTEQNATTLQKSAQAIPKDMMRRLLQLCHPDKHNGSETATRATEWLLSQR